MSSLRIAQHRTALGAPVSGGQTGSDAAGDGASFALALDAAGAAPRQASSLGATGGNASGGPTMSRKRGDAPAKTDQVGAAAQLSLNAASLSAPLVGPLGNGAATVVSTSSAIASGTNGGTPVSPPSGGDGAGGGTDDMMAGSAQVSFAPARSAGVSRSPEPIDTGRSPVFDAPAFAASSAVAVLPVTGPLVSDVPSTISATLPADGPIAAAALVAASSVVPSETTNISAVLATPGQNANPADPGAERDTSVPPAADPTWLMPVESASPAPMATIAAIGASPIIASSAPSVGENAATTTVHGPLASAGPAIPSGGYVGPVSTTAPGPAGHATPSDRGAEPAAAAGEIDSVAAVATPPITAPLSITVAPIPPALPNSGAPAWLPGAPAAEPGQVPPASGDADSAAPPTAPTDATMPNPGPALVPLAGLSPSPAVVALELAGEGRAGLGDGGHGRPQPAAGTASDPGSMTVATMPGAIGAAAPAAAPATPISSASADVASLGGVSDQVGAHLIRLVSTGSREMVMRLHPPELGEVMVRVAVSGRDVSAWFASPQPQVQDTISAAMGQLQTSLGDAGYNLNGAWVGGDAANAQQRGPGSPPAAPVTSAPAAPSVLPPIAAAQRPAVSGLNIYV